MSSASTVSKVSKRATPRKMPPAHSSVALEEARLAGLLDGEKTQHVSFRAPKALIDAAMRESGTTKITELGILALAMLAQTDPAAEFLKKTRGKLGVDHKLEY